MTIFRINTQTYIAKAIVQQKIHFSNLRHTVLAVEGQVVEIQLALSFRLMPRMTKSKQNLR